MIDSMAVLSAPAFSNWKIEILVDGLLDLRWILCQIPFTSIYELFGTDIQAMFQLFFSFNFFPFRLLLEK